MIVMMKGTANSLMIEAVIREFERRGFEVQIKNGKGEEALIAIFGLSAYGLDALRIRELPGVKSFENSNRLFLDTNGEGFVEPWEFRLKNRK